MKQGFLKAFGLVAAMFLVLGPDSAAADAVGPYYASPSWDQQMPAATRFVVLSNWVDANYPSGGAAVLDRETGLVWERTPSLQTNTMTRFGVWYVCVFATTGGRQGWRLPRVEELFSLADPSNVTGGQIHIPSGHPFNVKLGVRYWAANIDPVQLNSGGPAHFVFFDASSIAGAYINDVPATGYPPSAGAWCVRGAGGSTQ